MSSPDIRLDDKYTLKHGQVYVNGTQALVRLALFQSWRDRDAGLNTAGYVTGYRGSPVGNVDSTFEQAAKFTEPNGLKFQPGLNEDIAATAVLGTQQINLFEGAEKQGVYSMWYAKGPGVDRSGDALRHGNLAGSSPYGGVLLLAGDDHTCKSSTTSHQSEYALMDAMIPVLNPAGVQEIIDYGLYGWAMSRYSGTWVAMKLIAETMDSSASIHSSYDELKIVTPTDFEIPEQGLSIRWPDTPQEQERRLHNAKLPAAMAFARANRIDRVMLESSKPRLGIVTTGKSYLDVRQALNELGLTDQAAGELGITVYKVGMTWPLEPVGLAAFAEGLEEILVVEEKRPLIESQLKDQLFNLPSEIRPRIYGKRDAENVVILPAHDDLTAVQIARAIAARLLPMTNDETVIRRIASLSDVDAAKLTALPPVQRTPYFCSGCPHSTSTRLPEGSRGLAGIGCHWMSQNMDRNVATYTHMGGEGANWIGQAPFVSTSHIFQNIGDGTYFHSGLLAIRAAVAAKVNITYKILFNDATAMTGGQRHDGVLTPQRITHQLRSEGVRRIAVLSDDIEKYHGDEPFASDVSVHHRSELDAVQRELREIKGVSALVYDQTCAAEKRRRRKRQPATKPVKRVIINELVCEGCGDCSVKSNCLSVTPVDTEWGRKRRIDQSSCNQDLSCVEGFCPSLVTVEGGTLFKPKKLDLSQLGQRALPNVELPSLSTPWNMMVTGVGGTGVITIGAILAMAAHYEGKGCSTLDMTGMAQKGGPVTSHIRFAAKPADLHAVRISPQAANVVLACDLVVAAGKEALGVIKKHRTKIILNTQETITGAFIRNRDFKIPSSDLLKTIQGAAGAEQVATIAATQLAETLFGDSIATNLFMVGYAYQSGLIPVSAEAIAKAIELNGAAIELNKNAFMCGRLAAVDLQALLHSLNLPTSQSAVVEESVQSVIDKRVEFLTSYQNARYARVYSSFMDEVRAKEGQAMGREGALTEIVAKQLFKLMAYKDEYEVGRLYTDGSFDKQLKQTFGEVGKITFHLAPPALGAHGAQTKKKAYGAWMMHAFGLLAKLKFVRGTPLDVFGYTAERKMERGLAQEYKDQLQPLLAKLTAENHGHAVAVARVAEEIRGYGHVKEKSVVVARQRWSQLKDQAFYKNKVITIVPA